MAVVLLGNSGNKYNYGNIGSSGCDGSGNGCGNGAVGVGGEKKRQ